MVRRSSTLERRGLSSYKLVELLTGDHVPATYYTGYGDPHRKDSIDKAENYIDDVMRADWGANREALLAFWNSGKYSTTDDLAEFGLDVRMPPWLFVHGSPGTLPWAAKQFDWCRRPNWPRISQVLAGPRDHPPQSLRNTGRGRRT